LKSSGRKDDLASVSQSQAYDDDFEEEIEEVEEEEQSESEKSSLNERDDLNDLESCPDDATKSVSQSASPDNDLIGRAD